MPTAWPPAGNNVPPFTCSDWDTLLAYANDLIARGWTQRSPTNQENNNIFQPVRCDLGHIVGGSRVFISPGGTPYYFAICNTNHEPTVGKSRAFFVPWPPYYFNDFPRA